jgi:hypothetical protein
MVMHRPNGVMAKRHARGMQRERMSQNHDTYRLWQHDNGIWHIIWSERSENKAGNLSHGTKHISAGTTDRKAAEQYRAQFIAGLNNPAPPEEPTMG